MEQGDTVTVTVEFEDDTLRRIDDIAIADGRSNRETVIRELLNAWFRDRER